MAKRLTDEDRQVMAAAGKIIDKETQWFYEEVKKRRGKIKDSDIKEIEAKLAEGNIEENGNGKKKRKSILLHLKDICKLMDWQFPRDKEVRSRLQKLANVMLVTSGDYGAPLLFQVVKRGLKEDVDDATDFFLSKKEQRRAKKRRKTEEVHGVRNEIKGHMSEEEKIAARKKRSKTRKEAKKLGITTDEYKKLKAKESSPKEAA